MTNLYVYDGQPYYDPISPPTHVPYLDNEGNAWAIPLGQFPSNVETIDLQRNEGDGWVTIAKDIDPTSTYVDHIPRIGEVRYRAISKTSLPSQKVGPVVTITTTTDRHYINTGQGFQDVTPIEYNHVEETETGRAREALPLAGNRLPTLYTGEAHSRTIRLSFRLTSQGDWETIEDLAWTDGEAVHRTPDGRKAFVGIMSSTLSRPTGIGHREATLAMQQVDYDEGAE